MQRPETDSRLVGVPLVAAITLTTQQSEGILITVDTGKPYRTVKGNMKTRSNDDMGNELRHEYDLRQLLKEGVQGKYATRCRKGTNLVLLDPEVAKAFPTDSAVNAALRLVLRLSRLSTGTRKVTAKSRAGNAGG